VKACDADPGSEFGESVLFTLKLLNQTRDVAIPVHQFSMTSGPRPYLARKYGPATFERFDHLDVASIGSREIGKVLIDCKFRLSDSQWGTLGNAENPAGIIYMDLDFKQPQGCRLANATILVKLEYDREPDRKSHIGSVRSNHLYVTEQFGPKELRGPEKIVALRKNYHFTPNVNVLGNGAGGVGVDREKLTKRTSRWIFSGNTISDKGKGRNMPRSTAYRTMKWELQENDLEAQSVHNPVFHTAFAFEHERKPFFLKVEITGKLLRKRDQWKQNLKFPPARSKDQGQALTLVSLKDGLYNRRLDAVAKGLALAMQKENAENVAVELQDTLPASFHEAANPSPLSNHQLQGNYQPPDFLSNALPPLTIEDQMTESLLRAIPVLCNPPAQQRIGNDLPSNIERGISGDIPHERQSRREPQLNHEHQPQQYGLDSNANSVDQEDLKTGQVNVIQDSLDTPSQYSPFIMMFQLFASLLGIFGGIWPSNENGSASHNARIVDAVDDIVKRASAESTGQGHQMPQPKSIPIRRNRPNSEYKQNKVFDGRAKQVDTRYLERVYREARSEYRRPDRFERPRSRTFPSPPPPPARPIIIENRIYEPPHRYRYPPPAASSDGW
jgi:hypothetical protein